MSAWSGTDDDEQLKLVYAHTGLALYLAQCFEMSLSNFLLIVRRLDNGQISEAEFNSYDIQLQKKTLGKLLSGVKGCASFDRSALQYIDEALERRNFLAHGFFRERAMLFLSSDGRQKMTNELIEMQDTFKRADAIASALVGVVAQAIGVTDEMIDSEFEKLRRKQTPKT